MRYQIGNILVDSELAGLSLVDSKQILTAQEDGGGNYHSQGAVHTGPSITPGRGGGGGG